MQKTGSILKKRLNQHGLGKMVEAGLLCRQAEIILPDIFQAVSVKPNLGGCYVLHLRLPKANLLKLRMEEGRLLKELNLFAQTRQLPIINKIRLTFSIESDTI